MKKVLLILSFLFLSIGSLSAADMQAQLTIVGGDRDAYGCIGSAGYSWDASLGQCARPWEKTAATLRAQAQSGSWTLVSLNGTAISGGTLTFQKGNILNAKICNNINGRYIVTKNTFILRWSMSTMMYCEGDIMKVENAFNSISRAQMSIVGDMLTLTTQKGDIIVWKRN